MQLGSDRGTARRARRALIIRFPLIRSQRPERSSTTVPPALGAGQLRRHIWRSDLRRPEVTRSRTSIRAVSLSLAGMTCQGAPVDEVRTII